MGPLCSPSPQLASQAQVPLKLAAEVYFLVGDRPQILWLLSAIIDLSVQGRWQALARANKNLKDQKRVVKQTW